MIASSSRLGCLGSLAPALENAIRGAGLDAHTEEIRHIGLPCVALAPQRGVQSAGLGASRVGGLPDLPSIASWPCVDGAYLSFLAQINLSSLPSVPHNPLPPRGLLSLFLGENESTLDVEHRVLLIDEGRFVRTSLPANAVPRDEYSADLEPVLLAMQPVVSLPGYQSELRSQLSFSHDDEKMDRYDRMVRAVGPTGRISAGALLGHGDGDELEHAIDGYASRTGRKSPRSMRRWEIEDGLAEALSAKDAVLQASCQQQLGEYEWWIENALHVTRESHHWRLLLKLESLSEAGLNFWDAGSLNVYIHDDDLRAGRFDQTRASIETS